MLTVTAHHVAEIVVLRCRGRLVRGEESALLCAAVRHHGRDVVLDFGEVSAIDAAGIGALVSLQAAGVYLKLLNPTGPVRDVLRLTRLEAVFEICEAKIEELLGGVESVSTDAEFYVRESKLADYLEAWVKPLGLSDSRQSLFFGNDFPESGKH